MDAIRRLSPHPAWFRPPFPAMLLLVLALYLIREEFPFSNFPMYSNISEEADVTFVTDQNNQPLPMKASPTVNRTCKSIGCPCSSIE